MSITNKQYLEKKIERINNQLDNKFADEYTFNYLIAQYFYIKDPEFAKIEQITDMITDGKSDGGIDFIYYDENEDKIYLNQLKYSKNISKGDILSEIRKINKTYTDFKKGNTGDYSLELREVLQNAIDRLPEDNKDDIEVCVFVSDDKVNVENLLNDIEKEDNKWIKNDNFSYYDINNIVTQIENVDSGTSSVSEDKLIIDNPKNILAYNQNSHGHEGIMVNISSESLRKIYNKYSSKGLFDLNIRRFVKNKQVDEGIQNTIKKFPNNFWFLNNGITIACEDFLSDGNTIKLFDFSIVNGGQTTTHIGEYKGTFPEFFIPCKIIKIDRNVNDFYNQIAEATNSQKPITPRDLKANAPEMIQLRRWLKDEYNVELEIKRGVKKTKKYDYIIKNDDLGKIIHSFRDQCPGKSRSANKLIFSNNALYNSIFKQRYHKSEEKKAFLFDLIKLNDYIIYIFEKIESQLVDKMSRTVLKSTRLHLMAVFGIIYRVANKDIQFDSIMNDNDYENSEFIYGSFISNYKSDDFDMILEEFVHKYIVDITEECKGAMEKGEVTSISNLLKTEHYYRKYILGYLKDEYSKTRQAKEWADICSLFIRK